MGPNLWYLERSVGLQVVAPSEPGFRVLHRIGQGGMAELFLAQRGARRVVLKRVLPHLVDDPFFTGMLRDEVELGLRCRHPNVVATLEATLFEGRPCAVLEHVDGPDLAALRAELSRRGERIAKADAVAIAIELCQALRYLHGLCDDSGASLGIIHRDVTPPNVLLGTDGAVKLCDLGFARCTLQRTRTEPGLVKGKFSYLSPEAAHGRPVDVRADVFAIGIMLWEMLSMQRLFNAATDYETVQRVREARIPPLAPLCEEVDEVLEEIVQRALSADPAARYPTAEALYNALAAYADWQELGADIAGLVARARLDPTAQTVEREVARRGLPAPPRRNRRQR